MTCSGVTEMMKRSIETKNCHTCKYYINGMCTHPEFGEVLSLFLADPNEACPFWEGKEDD